MSQKVGVHRCQYWVAANWLHLNVEVADSSEPVGDAGLGLAQPVVVRDADVVHVFQEGVFTGKHQLIQALGSRLLHPLEAELDVDRKLLQQKENIKTYL